MASGMGGMRNVESADSQDIDSDDLELVRITGHKPVLERNYDLFSLLAFSFMIIDSWIGIVGGLSAGISSGGPAMLIYGAIGVTAMTLTVALSLAEISGAYPTSGGQYHWTAELSPPEYGPVLSWFCGYFNVAGWCLLTASVNIMSSQFVMAVVVLCHPGFKYQRWQGFIVYQLFNAIFTAINIMGRKNLPSFNKINLFICVAIFLAVNITLLVCSSPKNPVEFVFNTFINNTGWKSDGMGFIVGLIYPTWCYSGIDNAVHMAEEIKDARRALPIVLISTVGMGFATMIITSLTLSFTISDLGPIISSTTGTPILEILYNATKNKAAAVFLLCSILWLVMVATVGAFQTTNRLIWAFARDGAMPWSNRFSSIHLRLKVPVNAALLCWATLSVLGVVYLVSSTAFNAFVGCNVVILNISFAFPIALMLFGRRKYMKPTTFSLGNILGRIINAIALLWITFMVIFFNFPFQMPVKASNMRIVGLISAISWFWKGHKSYTGPKMDIGIDAAYRVQLLESITANKHQKEKK
ncbi:hypothetical protein FQN57_005066 [Myotisia sp. PD_48]|nr:hypothetical protein FQN57_005066 [Myotisia sp. PD_48]